MLLKSILQGWCGLKLASARVAGTSLPCLEELLTPAELLWPPCTAALLLPISHPLQRAPNALHASAQQTAEMHTELYNGKWNEKGCTPSIAWDSRHESNRCQKSRQKELQHLLPFTGTLFFAHKTLTPAPAKVKSRIPTGWPKNQAHYVF